MNRLLIFIIFVVNVGIPTTILARQVPNQRQEQCASYARDVSNEFLYPEDAVSGELPIIINKSRRIAGAFAWLQSDWQCQEWKDVQWTHASLRWYTYDGFGNEIEDLRQVWDSMIWIIDRREISTYDDGGLPTIRLNQRWDGSNWVNSHRYRYVYNDYDQLVEYAKEYAGQTDDTWINRYVIRSSYDEKGLLAERIEHCWCGNPTGWELYQRFLYSYDDLGNVTVYLRNGWDGARWIDVDRTLYEFDSFGNKILDLRQRWDGTQYVDRYRFLYTYDALGNRILSHSQEWDGTGWSNERLSTNTYDSPGNLASRLVQICDNGEWTNDEYCTGTYRQEHVEIRPAEVQLHQNFPNPFDQVTTFFYHMQKRNYARLSVYDVLGREVAVLIQDIQPRGVNSVIFDAGQLPSGMYICRLEAGTNASVRNIVLVR